ncbi:hypothetical protein GJ744_001522 [Endocarpon pusillum]|uniref:BTB domain-containing protein n=1 Tax=Endocarpon pusillum TaxID=364733 RepID=A0A8H7E3A8_9EURO|nr:hypothetical protein GJ744_001522 [Endocarpon pusillum]
MGSYGNDDLPHKWIKDAQLSLLFSEKAERYTDAKVTCKGIEWKVRQSILCTRCPFFEACFRKGTFKEGEEMSVDFDGDEQYAVEALLIYLYTLEYPNQNLPIFKVPAVQEKEPKPAVPEATDTKTFKLKSEAPLDLWKERLALYRITHRLGLDSCARASLGIMATEIKGAVQSSNVSEFIGTVYGLNQEEARALQEKVATEIAEQKLCVVPQPLLDPVLISHPLFGCDLVKALRKKFMDLAETIANAESSSDSADSIMFIPKRRRRIPPRRK